MKKLLLFVLFMGLSGLLVAQTKQTNRSRVPAKPPKQFISEVSLGVSVLNFSLPLKNVVDSAERALVNFGIVQNLGAGLGIQYNFVGGTLRDFKFDTAQIQQSFSYKLGAALQYRLDNGYVLKKNAAVAPFFDLGVNRFFVERQQDGILEEFKVNYLNYGAGARFKITDLVSFKYATMYNQPLGASQSAHWQHSFGLAIKIMPSQVNAAAKRDLKKDLAVGEVAQNAEKSDLGGVEETPKTKIKPNKSAPKTGDARKLEKQRIAEAKALQKQQAKARAVEAKAVLAREKAIKRAKRKNIYVATPTPKPAVDTLVTSTETENAAVPAQEWVAEPAANAPAGYYIVVASPDNAAEAISEQERAQKQFAKAKIYYLPTDNGRYRVGLYAGTKLATTEPFLAEVRQKLQPSAWKASYAKPTTSVRFVQKNIDAPTEPAPEPEPMLVPVPTVEITTEKAPNSDTEAGFNANIPRGYYVILNSFPKLEAAQKYGEEVSKKYSNLYIMKNENMYRVGIYTNTIKPKEAEETVKRVRVALENPSAWKLLIK